MPRLRGCVAALLLASATGVISSARAADVSQPPLFMPVPVASPWNGFYIGANVGGGGSSASADVIGTTGTTDMSGGIAGGQIGANWQTGSVVWGVEADAQASWQQ